MGDVLQRALRKEGRKERGGEESVCVKCVKCVKRIEGVFFV
jgi:hypothetical protein